ncbi:MAG: hypothetical protein ABFD25_14510 [Clostridiaceae bacterium]
MKKNTFRVFALLFIFLYFTGCNNSFESTDTKEAQKLSGDISISKDDDGTAADSFLHDSSSTSLGAFSFGIVSDNNSKQIYEYNGNELHIPFNVMGLDENASSDFGLMVFVDGLSQPYKIAKKNGEATEAQYMHKFYLNNKETQEFDIVFTPVTGKKGERVGVVFSAILNPDFMPQSEHRTSYGIYHSLSATLAQEIYFQCTPINKNERLKYSLYEAEDIPQEIIDKLKGTKLSNNYNPLDSNFVTELSSQDKEAGVLKANNGKVKFEFHIYGGQEATYRTIFFIDHKPVSIMGADYLETRTKKEKMCSAEIELDIKSLNRLSTLYAITTPAGKDYMAVSVFPIKTRSTLLVNDMAINEESNQAGIEGNKNITVTDSADKVSDIENPEGGSLWQNVSYDYETNCLVLSDGKTNTIIKKIPFEENSYAQKTYKFDKGYVVQVAYADKPVKIVKDQYGYSITYPKTINRCILRVYDGYLNLKKEMDIFSEMPEELLGAMAYSAVSGDGEKIVWAYLQKLYICEVPSGKIKKVKDEADNQVFFSQICYAKDNKSIFFAGSSTQTNEGDCVYGLIDPDNKNMTLHVEEKYHPGYIRVTAGYAWLCDNVKPISGTAGGRVPILDLQTKKAFTMKVDGAESAHAIITEDGKYLLAVKEKTADSYRIRQYSLATGEMVNEKTIGPKEGALWNIDLVYAGDSSIYNLIGCTKDGKYVCYPFVCEDK